jgi:hypothetical protein
MAGRIADDELNRLRGHLLACCPDRVANLWPGVAATLRHFRVEPMDSDDEPPPADA